MFGGGSPSGCRDEVVVAEDVGKALAFIDVDEPFGELCPYDCINSLGILTSRDCNPHSNSRCGFGTQGTCKLRSGCDPFNEVRTGVNFATVQSLEASLEGGAQRFTVLERDRLSRYDLFGRLRSLVFTAPDSSGARDSSIEGLLPDANDPSLWVDLDKHPDGHLHLLSRGELNTKARPIVSLVRVSLDDGFDNFTKLSEVLLVIPPAIGGTRIIHGNAVASNPNTGADAVYALSRGGLERWNLNPGDESSEILFRYAPPSPGGVTGSWRDLALREIGIEAFDPDQAVGLHDVAVDMAGNVYLSESRGHRVHKIQANGTYVGWLGRCDGGKNCDTANERSRGFACTAASCTVTNESGEGTERGQFDFSRDSKLTGGRPRYGRLHVDHELDQIHITDEPVRLVLFGEGLPAFVPIPRVQSFSLDGVFLSEVVADGEPGDILSFLEPGDFTAVNDVSTSPGHFFVVEDAPLKRLHAFEFTPFNVSLGEGVATVDYLPATDFTGTDSFRYNVTDSFGADSDVAVVQIEVIDDDLAPVLTCPDALEIEKNDETVNSRALARFFAGASATDNVTIPLPEVTVVPDPNADDASPLALGVTTYSFTATDGVGNQSTCMASITLADTIAPRFGALPDVVVEAQGVDTAIELDATATDAGGATQVTASRAVFGLGTVEVEWTAIDGAGNTSTASQFVTVEDTIAPAFTPFDGTIVQQAVNGHSNLMTYDVPTAEDLVGVAGSVRCTPGPNRGICDTDASASCTIGTNLVCQADRQIACLDDSDCLADDACGSSCTDGGSCIPITVAAVPINVSCVATDSSSNRTIVQLSVDIVQGDTDGDSLVDLDPANASMAFSDVFDGGMTEGTIALTSSPSATVVVKDAYLKELGVRLGVLDENLNVTVVDACSGILTVTDFAPVELLVCDNDTLVSCTTDSDCPEGGVCVQSRVCGTDLAIACTSDADCAGTCIKETLINSATITCGSALVQNHTGDIVVRLTLPDGTVAEVSLPGEQGVELHGYTITAPDSNTVSLEVILGCETVSLKPGGSSCLERKVAFLDIKPGSCPSAFNPSSRGVLPVSLLGTDTFDVSTIDISTLAISLGVCVQNGSVAPLRWTFEDAGAPFDGDPFDCQTGTEDGLTDLSLKFSSRDVVAALGLDALGHGDSVELVVSGKLLDGCSFVASDFVKLSGRRTPPKERQGR